MCSSHQLIAFIPLILSTICLTSNFEFVLDIVFHFENIRSKYIFFSLEVSATCNERDIELYKSG